MGSAKSKLKFIRRNEEITPPNLDNIAIDLDILKSAHLSEDLSQNIYYIHYEMSNNNWYEGKSSTNKQLIEKRLTLALSAHNNWHLYKTNLTDQNDKNIRDKIIA